MASSSSKTPFSMKKYDVFLSCSDERSPYSFTSHLYDVLLENKISTFIDDSRLQRGDEISPALLNAIEESRNSLIIFSKDYAGSISCLEELVKILEGREKYNQIVLPIFYDIDPPDVRNQTGPFAAAFKNHEAHKSVQKWRGALKEAANLPCFSLRVSRSEAALTQDIVDYILEQLKRFHIKDIIKRYRFPKVEDALNDDIEKFKRRFYSGHKDEEAIHDPKITAEWSTAEKMFVATNLILELPSVVFDKLSSVHKPQYALESSKKEASKKEPTDCAKGIGILKQLKHKHIERIIIQYRVHKDEKELHDNIVNFIKTYYSGHKDEGVLHDGIVNIIKQASGHKDEDEDKEPELVHKDEDEDKMPKHTSSCNITADCIFVTTNLILEVPSFVFDQLSSVHKPQYALVSTLLSFTALFICVIQLAYQGGKARVGWRWRPKKIPWFYYPPPGDKPFGTVTDFIGLLCAICQSIFTAIDYALYLRNINDPIKISIWPLVFSFCLMCSTFFKESPEKVSAFCLLCSTLFKESPKKIFSFFLMCTAFFKESPKEEASTESTAPAKDNV